MNAHARTQQRRRQPRIVAGVIERLPTQHGGGIGAASNRGYRASDAIQMKQLDPAKNTFIRIAPDAVEEIHGVLPDGAGLVLVARRKERIVWHGMLAFANQCRNLPLGGKGANLKRRLQRMAVDGQSL